MKKFLLALLAICTFINTNAQENTVGLLSYKPSKAYDGYNLIYPHNQSNIYLLNNCGEVVHEWEGEPDTRPGNTAYLTDEGNIIFTSRPSAVAMDPIWAGGGGATIGIKNWDNELLWSYTLNDENERFHHDFAYIENTGNILAIVWEYKSITAAHEAGRDTMTLTQGAMWPDKIIELDPDTDQIVWEWHAWDHLIQDFDDTKANYGVIADNPGKININWDTNDGKADWLHSNFIDFNPGLNQIMLSVPQFDEFWIIDHSTTTTQAATSNGGLSNKGGDLMYRWGNPAAYDRGTVDDQRSFYQHNPHWADRFLTPAHPDFGKIVLFNNRVGADFSTVNTLVPAWEMYEWEYLDTDGVFNPTDFDYTFTHPEPTKMWSTGLSSVQLLPNGNKLICTGRFGYSFEVTPSDEIVWEYKTPIIGGQPATQGDTLVINNNLTFKLERYPADFAAFEDKDLTPKGWIELSPDEEFCNKLLPTNEIITDYQLKIYPNPATDKLTIEWEAGRYASLEIFDMMGRKVKSIMETGGRMYMDISAWETGVYFVRLDDGMVKKFVVQ